MSRTESFVAMTGGLLPPDDGFDAHAYAKQIMAEYSFGDDGFARAEFEVALHRHLRRHRSPLSCGPRARARRSRGRSVRRRGSRRSRAPGGSDDSGSEGAGSESRVERFARTRGLTVDKLRWCRSCGVIAYAVDDYQRNQLDRLGFGGDLCPECRERLS